MSTLTISWEDRLDNYYVIAESHGLDSEGCEEIWFNYWLPDIKNKYGKYDNLYLEPIPDEDMEAFEEFTNNPAEEE